MVGIPQKSMEAMENLWKPCKIHGFKMGLRWLKYTYISYRYTVIKCNQYNLRKPMENPTFQCICRSRSWIWQSRIWTPEVLNFFGLLPKSPAQTGCFWLRGLCEETQNRVVLPTLGTLQNSFFFFTQNYPNMCMVRIVKVSDFESLHSEPGKQGKSGCIVFPHGEP